MVSILAFIVIAGAVFGLQAVAVFTQRAKVRAERTPSSVELTALLYRLGFDPEALVPAGVVRGRCTWPGSTPAHRD